MGKEVVMVEDFPFQPEITTAGGKTTLELLGHGITDIEIHFLQIKFTAIGVYLDKNATVECLAKWKEGKPTEADLAKDELFYDAIIASPSEKVLRVVVIKEIKGSQYGVQLESSVRDRLAAEDKYEEEEELELEKLTEFFQSNYFKKGTEIVFAFHPQSKSAEVTLVIEGKEESKMNVGNANVIEMIQRWYLGGDRSVSPSTVKSLTATLAGILAQ